MPGVADSQKTDILLFAEDPGAANLVAPLPDGLRDAGLHCRFFADPQLAGFLGDRMIDVCLLEDDPGNVLDALGPRLVACGTSENRRGSSLAMLDAARERGITSLGLVDMLANAQHRFQGTGDHPLGHAPDWIAVPDTPTARAYERLGFPANNIVVCGHPHYDVVRARRDAFLRQSRDAMRKELLPDAPPDRPVLVFLAEGVDQLDPDASRATAAYTLRGSGNSDDRTTIVLEEVLAAAEDLQPRPYIVLRLHPKNAEDDYQSLRQQIDFVSHDGDPLPLLWCADGVVGMTTFLLVEASLLGLPTLSVLPRAEEADWLPTTADGTTPVVTARRSLRRELCETMDGPVCNRYEVRLPSGSRQNTVALIKHLLNHPRNVPEMS